MTDTEILNWLLSNITYMEHGSVADRYKYWPQSVEDFEMDLDSHYIGLNLRDYVETRISESLQ